MKKNNLDEMQEKKLLDIESKTLAIMGAGLFIAAFVQQIMWNENSQMAAGEIIVLIAASVYFLFNCIKNGIWDRKLKCNKKTNLIISLAVSLIMGIIWGIINYVRYHVLAGAVITFAIMFVSMLGLLMAAFLVLGILYKHRTMMLDKQADEEENEK